MSKKTTSEKIEFTLQQEELHEKLTAFLDDANTPIFLLKGYAGTGKTFMINQLVGMIKEKKRTFRLMAPTGRAAKVVAAKTKEDAYTIHKSIYSFVDMQSKKKKNNLKYIFSIKDNEDPVDTVYIVDEASMVADSGSESEQYSFGSGRLLKDLIRYINPVNDQSFSRKVLFVGDLAQLPPVGSSSSPALNSSYIQEEFDLNTSEYELTEVVRQKKAGGILVNATTIRGLKDDFHPGCIKYDYSDLQALPSYLAIDYYMAACGNRVLNNATVVTHSNRTALEYNQKIRSRFFPDNPGLAVGDKIILGSNNYTYDIELLNGDFGKVLQVDPEVIKETLPVYTDTGKTDPKTGLKVKKPTVLRFRKVHIRFWDLKNKAHDIEAMILEHLLYSPNRDLDQEERQALYLHFTQRYPKLRPGTHHFREKMSKDPYYNALRVKFGYAVTCHKAQGGEWDYVFVAAPNYPIRDEAARWWYTAITRAKKQVYIIR